MKFDPNMFYIMLALPMLFGLTLVGEGIYQLKHYESGWVNVLLGVVFVIVVIFGYFYVISTSFP
ncbi:hypothetical protein A2701_01950 [Candidatus Amesbacteria bacterium RIFCSPHIGHO2_01_FULL_47_34]|uniref:Uncharacterized protein n=2 Tax=Candidatus Amesiibacteriota TaxID=1752730 RepID=A0A1F4ZZ55_9BACT|nr:MAG: hypothetical protein A2701_01950 [Candidatus Amesbacteria bacterium RIFCSPHIGHO2_01_FULL_47_34]OGD00254.1 MAG: hypothetical protein A2972_03715 [Candidatus Amesbacteria bacterium RIFCSPLOWO2_01_FULL_47_33]OGD11146.1 MAG: hypothetical protein A2395_02555 [Candidatus Amesbacteria bacterium RIFOXYB1_FULL_47_9]